jgi:hypothetical protein
MKRDNIIILISILLFGILSTQNSNAQQSANLYIIISTSEGASIDGAHCVVTQNGSQILFDSVLTANSIIPSFDLTNGSIHFSLTKPFYNSCVNEFVSWGDDVIYEVGFGFAKCKPASFRVNVLPYTNILTWDNPGDCVGLFNTNEPNPYCEGYDLYRNGILIAEDIQGDEYHDQLDVAMACVYRLYAKYPNGFSGPVFAFAASPVIEHKRMLITTNGLSNAPNLNDEAAVRTFDWNNSESNNVMGFPHKDWGAFCKWPVESFINEGREHITRISFFAGDEGNEYSIRLSQDFEGKDYEQKVNSYSPHQWNEIVLDVPFALANADLTFGVLIKDQTGYSIGVNDEVNTWIGHSDLFLNNNSMESYSMLNGAQSFCLKAIAEPRISHNQEISEEGEKNTHLNTDTNLESTFRIYPNPTNDFAKVTMSVGIRLISVYDLNGRLISREELGGLTEYKLNLCKLKKGIYYVKINTLDRRVISEKIIVK